MDVNAANERKAARIERCLALLPLAALEDPTVYNMTDRGLAATGARLVVTSSQVQVYDASNVLRVRLGIW